MWRQVMRVRLETCRCTDGGSIYRWKNSTWTYEQWRGPDVGVFSLPMCTLPLRLVMEARLGACRCTAGSAEGDCAGISKHKNLW